MRTAEADILILPGPGNSGPGHWQRRWAQRLSTAQVIEQDGRAARDPEAAIETVRRAVLMATRPVVLIAHCLGVSVAVHTAARLADTKVRGAFLVAPPDLEGSRELPPGAVAFAPVPRDPLPFPSMLVASANDPHCSLDAAGDFANCWGSAFHIAGDAGHIDVASGHGPWPEGLMMFTRLMQRLKG